MQDIQMPGTMTDFEKYLIGRIDALEEKINSYHTNQEEKITKVRVKVAQLVVIMALVSTGISVTISESLKQPALPAERTQTTRR